MGGKAQKIAIYLEDGGVVSIAQACSGLDQRIEYFLHVEGRPDDDLQNIGGGRLLFQGFCQLAFAGLLGFEQPRIFDGDDGLVGEGLYSRALFAAQFEPGLGLGG